MANALIGRFAVALGVLLLASSAAAQGVPRLDSYNGVAVRILQSNNAGNVHHIIDPTINQVVGIIRGCPHAHNLTTHPDGLYYYCANEQQSTVDVFDTRTLQQVMQIPLSARPNKIVVNKKHRKMYAGIRYRTKAGAAVVDVIDLATHKIIKSISVLNPVHNTYVTPDDNFVIAGLTDDPPKAGEPTIQVIDPVTDTIVSGIQLTGHKQYGRDSHTVRPMAFEAGPDGATRRMFAQGTGINGIFVIDWATRAVTRMLFPPALRPWQQNADGIQGGDMHGLEVLPNKTAVWASSRLDSRIYGWTLPDLKYIGAVEVGPTANWMTPTPDSRFMYVAISGSDHTVAVDLQKLAIVAKIKTGARPARISTAILPLDRVNTPTNTARAQASNQTPSTTLRAGPSTTLRAGGQQP